MTRYARRVDMAQSAIVEQLRARGYLVAIYAHVGGGIPDLLIVKNGRSAWVEVKSWTRATPPTFEQLYRLLTEAERAFYELTRDRPPLIGWDAEQIDAEFKERFEEVMN